MFIFFGKFVEFLKYISNKVSTICKFVIEKADIFCQFIRTKMLIAYSLSNVVENACFECIFVSVQKLLVDPFAIWQCSRKHNFPVNNLFGEKLFPYFLQVRHPVQNFVILHGHSVFLDHLKQIWIVLNVLFPLISQHALHPVKMRIFSDW